MVKSHRRRSLKKVTDMPQNRQGLLDWVRHKYHAVTSFTELKRGNMIELRVGIESGAASACNILREDESLNAVARYEQPQLLSGCSVESAGDSLVGSVAFVIELEKAYMNGNTNKKIPVDVELEIKSASRRTSSQSFSLVLRAPSNVSWKVQTKRIKGDIDIVANSRINMSGIKVDFAGVRQERMMDSGQDLIQWVDYYVGPVSLYAGVELANKITLVLPDSDPRVSKKKGKVEVESPRTFIPAFENIYHTKSVFNRAIQTECYPRKHMVVSFSKLIMQNFGLNIDQLTLGDLACKASENRTHIILGLSPSDCGTQSTENLGKFRYSNVLLVHRTSNDVLETVGSGAGSTVFDDDDEDNEISGSGSHDSSTEADFAAENLDSDAIKIDVACEITESDIGIIEDLPEQEDNNSIGGHGPDLPWLKTNLVFKMRLYRSMNMKEPVYRFPLTVAPNSSIFVEVDIQPVENLRVMLQSCWLSPFMDRQTADTEVLIEYGCKKNPSVRFIKNFQSNIDAQRFVFKMGNQFRYVFLKCRLGFCSKNTEETEGVPCHDIDQMCGTMDANTPGRLVVMGPMFLSDDVEPTNSGGTTTKNTGIVVKKGKKVGTVPRKIPPDDGRRESNTGETIVIKGLDSGTVVGIAFAAFIIGVLLMAALWFIHTHTGPIKHAVASRGVLDRSGESTPMSTAPITINT